MASLDLASILPQPTFARLKEFLEELRPLVPNKLRALVLYGGLAKGKALTQTSDVNVLIILASSSLEVLDELVVPLVHGRRSLRIAPMLVSEEELGLAIKAFPVKFHDIAQYHATLLGEDPFARHAVPQGHLLENARQGLVNFSIRLKRFYVDRSERTDLLLDGLEDLISAAIISFRAVLHIKSPPVPERREEILDAIAKVTGTEAAPLQKILSMKKGGSLPPGAKVVELYGALLKTVEGALRLVS